MAAEGKFKHLEVKIGALALLVILFTVIALLYVGYQKDLFSKKIKYFVYSETGERLFAGIPVKFEGFRMGEVSKVELSEDGNIVLTLSILKRYQKWIKSDSRVFFTQESMIGNPYLHFTTGSADKEPMQEEAIFILEFEGGIDALIKEAKPVMEDVRRIVKNIRVISDKLSITVEDGKGAISYLMFEEESKVKIDTMLDKIIILGENANTLSTDLNLTVNERLNPVLDNISKTTRDLDLLRRKVDRTLNLGSGLLLKLNNTWPLAPKEGERKERPELPNP
ncbi:MAG: MCE family protein [Nitrospirota bacterium]|nr:MAG: MCE family protein [Nitrospirota bacterium]